MQNNNEISKLKEMVYDQVIDEVGLGHFYRFIMPEEVLVGPGSARKVGKEAAETVINEIELLISDLNLPQTISEVGGKKEDFKAMAEDALNDPTLITNPRQADLKEIIKIYENAL